ncbi:hypothetical protein KY290_007388 [Solanum tuberosum]|uniref:Uncharacterized protein n=1 Tax=Solanum tuberosum TaxID=4113 RepID=A0ABQ7W5K5_SOLTU|nr:hypothetical protein KY290_007388 [Solanum tuberosum]
MVMLARHPRRHLSDYNINNHRPSKPPPTKKRKTTEVKGNDQANKTAESESDAKSSDDDNDRPIPPPKDVGEPSVQAERAEWENKFVSNDAWKL